MLYITLCHGPQTVTKKSKKGVANLKALYYNNTCVANDTKDFADENKNDKIHDYACYTSSQAFKFFVEEYLLCN